MSELFQEMSLEPKEPKIIGYCVYCGDEVYDDEPHYQGDEGKIHKECFMEYVHETFTADMIARVFGYEDISGKE